MLNYRVTVFGFPSSQYLASTDGVFNPGFLDQRFCLEWLQTNVANFGGDPTRMIAFGQSAGSMGVGFLPYAYPKDPIITGAGQLSASPLIPIIEPTVSAGNFTDLASGVGCAPGNTTDKQIFKCMQTVPFGDLTSYIDAHPEKGYVFPVVADNKTAFIDIPARIASGNLAKLPTFMGALDNEGDSLVAFSFDGINVTAADAFGNARIKCPVGVESKSVQSSHLIIVSYHVYRLRVNAGLPTWRYRYSGIYPNLSPYSFIRTYHTSDVPMWIGSINVVPGLANATTPAQKTQSAYMQGALVAFASDPKAGLTEYGWPVYTADVGKTLVHLDPRDSDEVVVFENPADFDAPCTAT
jgi:carboxylesterase type B